MARNQVYFLSDLHLGAPYLPESREAERRITAFLDYIARDASEIYLLGDILDYWYEYRYVVPRGFVRFFGKLAELTDSGIRITWIIGNHDIWINDYIPSELGVNVIDGTLQRTILGKRFFLAHGDGLGKTSLSFRIIRSVFRNRLAQILYSGIHPRWTVPFAYAWSARSRKNGEEKKPVLKKKPTRYDPAPYIRHLADYSRQVLKQHPEIDYFVYGHLHVFARERLSATSEMVVLGEWIRTFSYVSFDGQKLKTWLWKDGEPEEIIL